MKPSSIYIIVPVYNEATVVEQTIIDLLKYPYSIILVDDGSTDNVQEIVKKYPIIFIKHSLNLGQGAALQTGMEMAKRLNAEIVIHFDADGQHNSDNIKNIIEPIFNNECDVVFGSRFLKKEDDQKIPFNKKVVLKTARYINWIFTGILLSDAHNGLRALNKNALEKIVITENKMAHASEILFEVKKYKLRYKEVPVTINYTKYSTQKGQKGMNAINIFFDLLFKKSGL